MHPAYPHSFHSLVFFLSIASVVAAALVNRTIDDEFGDEITGQKPIYTSVDPKIWRMGSTCTECLIHLDTSRVFRGTWKDATHFTDHQDDPTITVHFSGTAVYVYSVLAAYIYWGSDGIVNGTVTYLTFEIDGAPVGEFFRDKIEGITYGVPVYVNEGLEDGPHTLVIRILCGPDGKSWSYMLFDYIMYTASDAALIPSLSPSQSPPPQTTTPQTTPVTVIPSGPSPVFTPPSSSFNASTDASSSSTNASPQSQRNSSSLTGSSTSPFPSPLPDDPASTSTSTAPSAPPSNAYAVSSLAARKSPSAMIGGVVGGVAALAIAILAAWWALRLRRSGLARITSVDAFPLPAAGAPLPALSPKIAAENSALSQRPLPEIDTASVEPVRTPDLAPMTPATTEDAPRLRAQVAVLEMEVTRIRDLVDAPPGYEPPARARVERKPT